MQETLGQNQRKLSSMVQGINAQPLTRIKWPTRQPHMRRNAAHEQGDTSSIRGNTLSMNQTRSRGSTGPPELPTRLKTSHAHIYEMGAHLAVSRSSLGPNGHLYWSADQWSATSRFLSAPSSTWWLPIRCQGRFQEARG